MIRLALMLILFVSLAVASAAHADTSPSPAPAATETGPVVAAEKPSDERTSRPRWIPRQASRQRDFGPTITPYPVLFVPAGIPNLGF